MANTGNTQQQINYGSAANDGQGDPLRTAFIKTDDNFDAIWNAGPVGSNITVVNNTIQANNVNGNIVLRPNGVGVIQANAAILPNATDLRDLGSTGQRFRAAYIGTGGLSVDGNVTVTGNLTAGNISYTGNVFVGDLRGSVYADDSTIMVDAVDNTMFADSATFGTANVSGNVTANYFIGNGSLLTGVASSYGNADVAAFLATYNGNIGEANIRVGRISTGSVRSADAVIGNLWFIDSSAIIAPAGGSWLSQPDLSTEFINSPANGFINLVTYNLGNVATELYMEHGFVRIRVDNGGPEQDWNFRVDGTLQVPGDITPQSNGTASLGNVTNQWANLWVANNTIYIGGVPLGVTGNVLTVNGEPVLSNDSNTAITTTGNIAAGNILTDNYLYANGEPFVSASTGNITFTDTTMSPPDGVDITISAANSEVDIQALDFRVETTDDVRITGNGTVTLRNSSNANPITIRTDYDNNDYAWEFSEAGTLTTPGDIVVAGDITGTAGANTLVLKAQSASNTSIQLNSIVDSVISTVANLEIRTDVSNTAKTWEFDTIGDLTAPGNVSAPNFLGNIAAANVVGTVGSSRDLVNGTTSVRLPLANGSIVFDVDGFEDIMDVNPEGLTVWGNTANVQGDLVVVGTADITGNVTAANLSITASLFGTSGSPQPTISGFSTISATGNITGGNITTTGRVSASGNILGLNFGTEGSVQASSVEATGNISGGNLIATNGVYANIDFVAGDRANASAIKTRIVSDTNFSYIQTGNGTVGSTGNIVFSPYSDPTQRVVIDTGTGNLTAQNFIGNTAGFALGYRDIPQVAFTGNVTMAAADAGKHFYSTESTDYILTIADNSAVSWPVGTAITVVNRGTGNITVAQASGVSLYLAGNSSAGNRTVSTYGMATVLNVAANVWMINGTGVA